MKRRTTLKARKREVFADIVTILLIDLVLQR